MRGSHVEDRRRGSVAVVSSALRLTWQADRRGSLAAGAWQVAGAVSASGSVLVGKYAFDSIIRVGDGRAGALSVVPVVSLLAVLASLNSAAGTLQKQQQRPLTERVASAGWDRLLDVSGRVGLEHYESPSFFDRLERVRTNAIVAPSQITTSVFTMIGASVATLGLVVVLTTIAPILVPVLLLAGVPAVLLTRREGQIEFAYLSGITPLHRSREYLRQVMTNQSEAKEIRVFSAATALRRRHDERSSELIESLAGHVKVRRRYALARVVAVSVGLALTLAAVVALLDAGRISLSDAGAAALGARLLSGNLSTIFTSIGELFESSTYLRDLDVFLALAEDGVDEPFAGPPEPLRSGLVVRNLSFRYASAATDTLTGIDLRIGCGEIVALVGENGSGKTTLAKLVAGLYSPTSGSISWDDHEVGGDFSRADLQRSVAVIFQDFVRYKLSAHDNIGIGAAADIDDHAAAQRSAERVRADRFLATLPAGYETVLSTEFAHGTDLSVGQWQRVALARALRKGAPVMILDEPASALDPRAEDELFQDVRRTLGGKAALLISHRYSTVRTADRIYVMSEGRIVESGSHEALMAAGGLYADLFTLQARAYRS